MCAGGGRGRIGLRARSGYLPPGGIDISGPVRLVRRPALAALPGGEYSELEYWRRRAVRRARRGGPGCRRSEPESEAAAGADSDCPNTVSPSLRAAAALVGFRP